jgi:antitoxin (DNA-binding transcriptional repressor) of toxin-antitoxin stability system
MKTIDSSALHLPPTLLAALEEGETLILTQKEARLAVIVPIGSTASLRPFGLAKGEFSVPADFNDPLPDMEDDIYHVLPGT